MSKKKKAKATKAAPKSRSKGMLAPVVGVFLIVGAVAGYFMFARQPSPSKLQAATENCHGEGVAKLERRPVLPSSLFVGRVRGAYAAATAIPEVLDQLYCYCHCRENIGHKSLLSCYADNHAAGCDVCIIEAEMAAQMTSQGICPSDIQKAIDKRFSRF
jgi:hypothetical protein